MNDCIQLSVVIPTKNGGALFRKVLEGLRSQEVNVPWRLLVVDSGSTDGTPEMAQTYGAKILKIAPESFDHGATRNWAIENSAGEIVVLMTQDAVPADNHLLEALLAPFSDPQVAGSYARQSPRVDADVLTKRTLRNWLTGRLDPEVRWIQDRAQYDAMSAMEKYMFCNFDNVCSALRKTVWQKIPFQPNLFGEDIDWSKRVLEAGWKVAYEPSAHVIHSHRRTVGYEYKRTYMCHRKLYGLFGLRTIPTFSTAFRSMLFQTYGDWRYLLRKKAPVSATVPMLLKIPLLAAANAIAQYKGAADEFHAKGRRQKGI